MFIAIIFNSSAEGIEGELIFGAYKDALKNSVVDAVKSQDSSGFDFEWTDETYYPVGDPEYGRFTWGKIYAASEYSKFSFSEFS